MQNARSSHTDTNRIVNQQSADPNSNFDALIDLLASDDIHDIAVADSSHSPHHTVQLRDASGKLDFDKIRLMFAMQNLGADGIDDILPDTHSDIQRLRAQHGNDVHDALNGSGLSRSVSPSSQSSHRRRQGSRLSSADSSAPPDQNDQNRNTQQQSTSLARASHSCSPSDDLVRIGSGREEHFSRRELPSAQITAVNPVLRNQIPLPHQGSSTEKSATRLAGLTVPLTAPLHAGRVQDFTTPLQFEHLNDELSRTASEVDSLREQYETLRTLVAERLLPLKSLQTGKPYVQPPGIHNILPSQAQTSVTQQGLDSAYSDEILRLSEHEAKKILTDLIASLQLSARPVTNLVSECSDEAPDVVCPQPSSVKDIRSSMDFLASVDELVWKRSVNDSGPDPLYSRANTGALLQRLVLWEKTVRGPHKG